MTGISRSSQGMSGGPWIGPTVEEILSQLKKDGYETVVIQPVGFLCDPLKSLRHRHRLPRDSKESELKLIRAGSLNDSSVLLMR
jgi:ferrochelatase